MSRSNLGLATAPLLGGADRLWREVGENGLTINSQTVKPTFWFDHTGLDDTAKTWTCRKTGTVLSEAGAGTSPDLAANGPALGEGACDFANAKYQVADGYEFAQLRTYDFVIEVVLKATSDNPSRTLYKSNDPGGGSTGFQLYSWNLSTSLNLYLNGTYAPGGSTGALTEGAWYHIMWFANRDESAASGCRCFVNGVQKNGTNISSVNGDIQSTDALRIGYNTTHTLAHAVMWQGADWLATSADTEHLTIAKERASLYFGHRALHGHGALTPSTL